MSSNRLKGILIVLTASLLAVACAQTDAGITAKLKAKLASDTVAHASNIEVETRNHVVTLTGNVDNREIKDRALELARNTKGVADVVDMIAVRTASGRGDAPDRPESLGGKMDDAGITLRVKGKLLDDPDVKGLRIDVDTRAGVVFLTGSVGSENERQKAVRLARETDGVRDVQANLSIQG